jgi:DNA-binding protein YbaB
MFDNIKKMKQLRDLKNSLAKETIEVEKEGVKIIVNGNMEVEDLKLNNDLKNEKQGEVIKDCFNEAIKKIQRLLAEKMMQM